MKVEAEWRSSLLWGSGHCWCRRLLTEEWSGMRSADKAGRIRVMLHGHGEGSFQIHHKNINLGLEKWVNGSNRLTVGSYL